jgi:hypothetical protein
MKMPAVKMIYLGYEAKTSSKSGKSYLMAKFMYQETSSIYEFYIPSDKLQLVTTIGQIKPFSEVNAVLAISSFSGRINVDLEAVGK